MEACGAVYTSGGVATDPYSIFKDHGCNLVRLRLWHTPSWYDALNDGNRYSDLEDVAFKTNFIARHITWIVSRND